MLHRANHGAVQCQKRWSNLTCNFKKIWVWKKGKEVAEGKPFWAMRNDCRWERRLPGFFDRKVYEILDEVAGVEAKEAVEEEEEEEGKKALATEEEEDDDEEEEAIFDSGRTAVDDGLFFDFEQEEVAAVTDEAEERPRAMVVVPAQAPLVRVNQGNGKERKKKTENWGTIWPSGTAHQGCAWLGMAHGGWYFFLMDRAWHGPSGGAAQQVWQGTAQYPPLTRRQT